MLTSLAGDMRICQVVDPLMTCRLEIPKSILTTLGIPLSAIGLESQSMYEVNGKEWARQSRGRSRSHALVH